MDLETAKKLAKEITDNEYPFSFLIANMNCIAKIKDKREYNVKIEGESGTDKTTIREEHFKWLMNRGLEFVVVSQEGEPLILVNNSREGSTY